MSLEELKKIYMSRNKPQSLKNSFDDVKYEQYINNLHDRLPSLVDPNDIDCNRWPWELVQNAKDTVVKRPNPNDRFVDIKIKYYIGEDGKKKLYFEHNGDQFTDKAITGIIWKYSAEKRDEQLTEDGLSRDKQSTGRFGTGFMTTHALSLTVDISGSIYNGDDDYKRNVSVDFTLHREGPTDQDYKDGVRRTEDEMEFDMKPIPNGGILPTRFTYHLKRDVNSKAAEMGMNNVRLNAAQTMLFCPTVRSIRVEDDINDSWFEITRQNVNNTKDEVKETVFIERRSDSTDENKRRFVSMEIEEYSLPLSSHWKGNNRNLRLHVAVEVDKDNNIIPIPTTSPSVYCSLPMIGFEQMSLPFYVNSNDFEPATERTSLYLKKKRFELRTDEETDTTEEYYLQSGINWSILERSVLLYEELVDYLIVNNYHHRYNLINGLGEVLKGAWGTETKNCLASRFIVPLRSMLVTKELVKTNDGVYKRLDSDVKFVECTKDSDLHKLYDICKTVYGDNLTVEDENECWVNLKWGRYSFDSDFEERKPDSENPSFPTVKYDKVANYIEDAKCLKDLSLIIDYSGLSDVGDEKVKSEYEITQKIAWLNSFYGWVEDSKITNLSEKKIVPNRLGNFCSTEQGCDLKDASDIPSSIFSFMKRIQIDWDNNLLMEGVEHIVLTQETKDNVVIAIKKRTKEIRDDKYSVESSKLTNLLPLLMALPVLEDGRTDEFYKKRSKILSILKTVYKSECENVESASLELKAETWDESDKWLMSMVASHLADRKHLDVVKETDTEEQVIAKYCTSEWLSDKLNFMFDKGYLHLDDITESESSTEVLSLIPNRYGDFKPINKLYKQGLVPDKLLDDCLKDTGFDIKEVLLYTGFSLNEKAKISDYSLSALATKYNEYFEGEDNNKKESVSTYLMHLVPECGEQYEEIRKLYDEYHGIENAPTYIIKTSDLNIWKGAKDFMINLLAESVSECNSVLNLGKKLKKLTKEEPELTFEQKTECREIGMSWLNRLAQVVKNNKISIDENLCVVPDWYGILHPQNVMIYDGSILSVYNRIQSLVEIIEGKLWSHFDDSEKEKGDDKLVSTIVNSKYVFVKDFQDNTDEKLFSVVDNLVSYCCEHNDTSWRQDLKNAINSLLHFFEDNSSFLLLGERPKWIQYFHETYKARKELYYDYICDAATKAQISRISENFDADEIDELIKQKESVKKILAKKDYYENLEEENRGLQARIEELKELDSVLKNYSADNLDKVKDLINKLIAEQTSSDVNDETPMGGIDEIDVVIVPKTYEIEVEDFNGINRLVTIDQVQYAGLSLDEIERYVGEAKYAVVKYFKDLNVKHDLGLEFDEERIAKHSYSQLYGISDKNGKEIPIVVHSYKGPQYRYFDLNWYDWQMLSREGSMLFVLTVTGLQCIPLYALPVRNFNISISNDMTQENRAALLTLAAVGKQYTTLSFDFGNNMPQGFTDPLPFDYVPEQLSKCIASIKEVCDRNVPQIADLYNYGEIMPLVRSQVGYSLAMKEIEAGSARDLFDAPVNETMAPSVGTSFID